MLCLCLSQGTQIVYLISPQPLESPTRHRRQLQHLTVFFWVFRFLCLKKAKRATALDSNQAVLIIISQNKEPRNFNQSRAADRKSSKWLA